MITLYELKPAFQNLLRPLSNNLAKRGITPNQITLTALFLSIVTGIIFCFTIFCRFSRPLRNSYPGRLSMCKNNQAGVSHASLSTAPSLQQKSHLCVGSARLVTLFVRGVQPSLLLL